MTIAIVHRIYEGQSAVPVVEHRFFGQTIEEATAVYSAHKQTDSFLSACDDTGRFGSIPCRSAIVEILEIA